MSGEYRSTVTVNQSEYDRLNRAERELRAVNSNFPHIMADVRREAAENLRRSLAPIDERQRRFERNLDNLGEEVRRQEQRTLKLLQRQREEFETAIEDLQDNLEALADWTSAEFQRQRQEYLDLIESQRQQLQAEIDAIDARIGNLEEREKRRRQLAEQWTRDASVLAGEVGSEYNHERFAPGELTKSENLIRLARQNLASDAAQTALGNAQQACIDLSQLRVTLQLLEQEWHAERLKAWKRAKCLSEQIEANRQVIARDVDGRDLEGVMVDVGFWSAGKLQALKKELQALLPRLQDPNTTLTTAELRNTSGCLLPAMEERLQLIVHEARLGMISAQQRYEIASIVSSALEGQGFTLHGEDCFYEEDDERKSTIARLRRLDGAEVAIRVVPVDIGRNELEIHSFDHDQITEHQLQLRQRDLCNVLESEAPVNIGSGKCLQNPDRGLIQAVDEAVNRQMK